MSALVGDICSLLRSAGFGLRSVERIDDGSGVCIHLHNKSWARVLDSGYVSVSGKARKHIAASLQLLEGKVMAPAPIELKRQRVRDYIPKLTAALGAVGQLLKQTSSRAPSGSSATHKEPRERQQGRSKKRRRPGKTRSDALERRLPGKFRDGQEAVIVLVPSNEAATIGPRAEAPGIEKRAPKCESGSILPTAGYNTAVCDHQRSGRTLWLDSWLVGSVGKRRQARHLHRPDRLQTAHRQQRWQLSLLQNSVMAFR